MDQSRSRSIARVFQKAWGKTDLKHPYISRYTYENVGLQSSIIPGNKFNVQMKNRYISRHNRYKGRLTAWRAIKA